MSVPVCTYVWRIASDVIICLGGKGADESCAFLVVEAEGRLVSNGSSEQSRGMENEGRHSNDGRHSELSRCDYYAASTAKPSVRQRIQACCLVFAGEGGGI